MARPDPSSDAAVLIAPLAQHRIPVDRLADWLAPHVPVAGGLQVHQFQGGMSNPTYLLTAGDGARYVLRKKPPGPLLPKAHQIDREYRVMAALAETAVPVPPMIALCQDPDVIGADFFVMGHVPGRIITPPGLDPVAPAQRRALMHALVDTLAALHLVDHRGVGLERFGRPDGYLTRQTARWAAQYKAAAAALPDMIDYADFDWLRDWLTERVAGVEAATLVHGDFRVGNTITDPSQPRTAAVLDWELSTVGHPLSDLGYFCLPFHQPHDAPNLQGLQGLDLPALGLPTEDEVLARYCAKTGRAGIPDWPLFTAFSFFRIAAIVHGVAARTAQGNVSTATADAAADCARAGLLARIGVGIAQAADRQRREI